MKTLDQSICELVRMHKTHLEHWQQAEKDLKRLTAGLVNHRQQRNLLLNTDISGCTLDNKFPFVKDALLQKLDIKIRDYELKLAERIAEMDAQKAEVLRLTDACRQLRTGQSLSDMSHIKHKQLSTDQLIELTFDADQLYLYTVHRMKRFLAGQTPADENFFSLAEFQTLVTHYYL